MNETADGVNSLAGVRLLDPGGEPVVVPDAIAAAYRPGDRIVALPGGDLLHIPRAEVLLAEQCVTGALEAFRALARIPPEAVTDFYDRFARAIEDPQTWAGIEEANRQDVQRAIDAGRSTTRLVVSEKMRQAMAAGLREWRDLPSPVGKIVETTRHPGWVVEHVVSPLGVVAFVFEGRPNVFADATGVLRSGNTAVMRIGRDALQTARAIVERALHPSLKQAGLPENAVTLVNSREHAAGWALFSDSRVALAVARGSGRAVRQLGSVARQAGIPASLHGTGGAWLFADRTADPERLYRAIYHSLDRKVCNTLNTVCLVEEDAPALVPVLLRALEDRNQADGKGFRLHVTPAAQGFLPDGLFSRAVNVHRAGGVQSEPVATEFPEENLGQEWEWEGTPELSLTTARDLEYAAQLFNRYSPLFVASLISEDEAVRESFFRMVEAPFYGDGFTRWVDGQFALKRPELGLSNWQNGRLLGRSGILSGDGIYTIRLRVRQQDPEVHR